MAVTQDSYTGNGTRTNYPFNFPYLKASDIKVSLDATATTNFTFFNATTIQFTAPSGGATATQEAGGAPKSGVNIKIFRETGIDSLSATFYAGSAIKSEDLNDNFTQNLYVTQEVNGRYVSALGGTMVGDLQLGEDVVLKFEGATDDNNDTTITVADPTQNNTITFPNVSGNVVTTGDTGTVATGMIANDAVTMDKLNSGALPTDITVASANIVDGTIVNADVNAAAAIDGTKVTPAFGSQNITTTGTAATGAQTVTGNIAVSGTVDGRDVAADGTKLDGIETAATADQTAAEIRTLVESATDSNVFTDADHTKLNGIDTGATDDQTASEIKTLIASSPLDSSHLAANSVTTSEIADPELTTLAGMQSGTASKLADSTALTADIADLNQIDGLTKQTTISDTDASFPTSGAVVDYVTDRIDEIGGFEAITNETQFPNTQPVAGVAISIADAGGIVVNGSGTSTTGRTVGGSTVTINGIASNFNSSTVANGIRFIVTSTGSGQVYNYHKATLKEDDLVSLSGDINDFSERYRVGSSNPTSSLDSGDLFFNTGTGKLLVYNGTNSAWEEAQSVGNFFISTLSPAFDGTTQNFTLSNAPTNVQQVLLSINGVIQKPNAGTSTPSEGFALDGSTVKLSAAPATGSDYFAVVMGSTVNIGTPSDNTVDTDILQNLSVSTAKIQNDAVTGDKLADDASTDSNRAVDTNHIKNNAVETRCINNGAVTFDKLGSLSVGVSNIQPDSVTDAKLADHSTDNSQRAVGTNHIKDAAVTLAKLEHGTSSNNGKFLRANNGADPTFETVNTDLVSDTSPQLGGLLDGNGNTANFTANNTGLGIPIGTTANAPTASNYKGYIRFDDTDDVMKFSNGVAWLKFNPVLAVLSSVTGTIFDGLASNLTLAGTGFLSSNLVVNFVQSSDSIDEDVTVTPTSDTAATVAVPAAVYNNVTAGNVVTIKVTNSDGQTSGTVNSTAVSLPSGGTITTYSSGGNNYRVHTFTTSGNFVNTIPSLSATYLIVAGGGGAACDADVGGGGGAGGLLTGTTSPSVATHQVVVGNGGLGANTHNGGQYNHWRRGEQGGNSSAFGITTIGGGYGQTRVNALAGGNGGSGGGGGDNGNQPGGSGTSGQGHNGGGNEPMNSNNGNDQGGGGGAGSAGSGRHPGNGYTSTITGTSKVYARGGSGYHHPSSLIVHNTDNYGWGGRGSTGIGTADAYGAKGVVIIRYQI